MSTTIFSLTNIDFICLDTNYKKGNNFYKKEPYNLETTSFWTIFRTFLSRSGYTVKNARSRCSAYQIISYYSRGQFSTFLLLIAMNAECVHRTQLRFQIAKRSWTPLSNGSNPPSPIAEELELEANFIPNLSNHEPCLVTLN